MSSPSWALPLLKEPPAAPMRRVNDQPIDLNLDPRPALGQPVVQQREESIRSLVAVAVVLTLASALIALGGALFLAPEAHEETAGSAASV